MAAQRTPPHPTTEEICPQRSPAVQEQPLGSEVLLYQEGNGQVGILNETAYFIWRRCDGRHTASEITAALARHFGGTDGHDVSAEAGAALAALLDGGLLVAGGPDARS